MPAKALDGALNRRLQLIIVAHIGTPRGCTAAFGCDRLGGGLNTIFVAADQHDGSANTRVVGGNFQPDAAATAGDQRNAALERVVGEHQFLSALWG